MYWPLPFLYSLYCLVLYSLHIQSGSSTYYIGFTCPELPRRVETPDQLWFFRTNAPRPTTTTTSPSCLSRSMAFSAVM